MSAITSHYNLAIVIQEQRRGNAVRALKQDLTLLNQRLDKHGIAAGQAASKTEQFLDKTKRLGEAIKRVLVPALLLATTAAAKFAFDGVKKFAEFDRGMQEVFTLLPERTQALENNLTEGIQNVGKEFGYLTKETIPALYQALSAGIPEANAINAVELAAKAAKAGASDLESTMRIGMAVVNAYGGEVYTLGEAYDLIFQLVDKGVPRLSDWGNTLQDVISIASEARTPFEDIVAALAVMTRQGDSAAEAAELLGFILMQMQIEGTQAAKVFMEATGTSYREWIATGHGLVEGLQEIDQYAIETGQHLDSMIGGGSNFYRDQQAARGTMELTGLHMQDLIDLAKQVGEEAEGSMEKAYGTAADNAQTSLDIMAAKWEILKIKIGEAVWQQKIFLGLTGEQHFENIETGLDYATGDMGEKLIQGLEAAIAEISDRDMLKEIARAWVSEDKTIEIPFFPDWTAFKESTEEGKIILAKALATYYTSIEDYSMDIRHLDLVPDYFDDMTELEKLPMFGDPHGLFERRMDEEKRANAALTEQIAEYYNAKFIYHDRDMEFIFKKKLADQEEIKLEQERLAIKAAQVEFNKESVFAFESYYSTQMSTLEAEKEYTDELKTHIMDLDALGIKSSEFGQIVHWIALDTHVMTNEMSTFISVVGTQGKKLFDGYNALAEASGEWTQVLVNNAGEVNEVMLKLGEDLSDDEQDVMRGILDTAEEGGTEWLRAWRRLQTDLTETQRNELIARMADLQAADGVYKGVWTGNKKAAEDAEADIIAALEAIETGWNNMVIEVFRANMLLDSRMAGTVEAQIAEIELMKAMGMITPEQAALRIDFLEKSQQLKEIHDEMFLAFIADGEIAEDEAYRMAVAEKLIFQNASKTTEELKKQIDTATDADGGYPYLAMVVRDDLNVALKKTQEEATKIQKTPIVPVVDMDKTEFDTKAGTVLGQLQELTDEPWVIIVDMKVNGEVPGRPPTQDNQATGTGGAYRTVPGGFPNDSYLVGLTTGEQYAVLTPGQARSQGGGGRQYIDQSHNTTIFNNHTAAAAAVSRAYLDTLYDQRLRRFAGE
jgi:hypothetical protein